MRRILFASVASAVLAVSFANSALAQQVPPGPFEGWMGEFNHASRQLLALAEATPAEKFGWRPADGVRSIAEVYMHVAVGNYLLLTEAGVESPIDLSKLGKEPEKSITDKNGVIEFLKGSFDAVRASYPSADMQKKVKPFSIRDTTADTVFLRMLVHNHEHMGQAIAYARMNGIAPPWSQQ
jgi:uncharacterized damage-inducible protein DinB